MTGRVYVLGAGFSRAVSPSMPMMGALSDAVQAELEAFDLPAKDTPVSSNFEQWLSYLVEMAPWLDSADQTQNRAAFLRVSQAVHRVILDAQAEALKPGAECPTWLRRLASLWQSESAVVITFNYDLFVELAWQVYVSKSQLGPEHPHTPRPATDLYPIPISYVGSRNALIFGGNPPSDGLKLLKLHGSLNWRYSGTGGADSDPLYEMGNSAVSGWTAQSVAPSEDSEFSAYDLEPMIVPPAAVKNPYYGNRMIRALWRRAAEAISDADELVLMGFSLPPTDLTVGSLLATTLPLGSHVTPVDTNRAIVDRLQDAFATWKYPRTISDAFVGGDNPIERWVHAYAPADD